MKKTMLKLMLPLVAATWTDAFRRVRNRIALVAAAICAAAAPLSSFAAAKSATLKVAGYTRSTTLTGFQALVKLSEGGAYGFSYAKAGGSTVTNIWFTSEDDTTVYPHEIDKWDTSGNSFVWVRLPELKQGTTFKMHWSDSASDVQTASGNVWDGYVGVWHMNKTGTTSEPDSTGNNLSAAPIDNNGSGASINEESGQVGSGRSVANSLHRMKVPSHKAKLTSPSVFTIGGWVKTPSSITAYPRIFVGNPDNNDRTYWEVYYWTDNDANKGIRLKGKGDTDIAGVQLSTDEWHYLTLVYDGTTGTIYDNGHNKKSGTINEAKQGEYFTIGGVKVNDVKKGRAFLGTFDEVRMYNGALSEERIEADYATMNNPTTFIKLVGEVVNEDLPYGALSAEPDLYVQTGLIAHFDGIRNAGADLPHDSTTRTWKNLVAGGPDAKFYNNNAESSNGSWNNAGNGFFFDGKEAAALVSGIDIGKTFTFQIVTDIDLTKQHTANTTGTAGYSKGAYPTYLTANTADNGFYTGNGGSTTSKTLIFKQNDGTAGWVSANSRPSIATWGGKYATGIVGNGMSYLFEGTTLANGQTCSGNKSIGARQYAWGGNSGSDTTRFIYGTYHSVRIYNAPLTEDQLAWNRVIDEIRFRGFVTNGVVVVASNIGVVGGGTETNGTYYVNGSHTFTAPASVTVGSTTYELQGYTLERYDDSTQTWVKEGTYSEASFAYKHSETSTGVRLTWNWHSPNEPDAYLDYVESDGRQWIDSGVQPGPTASVTPAIISMIVDADVDIIGGNSDCDLVGLSYNNFEPIKTYNGKYSAYVKNAGETTSGVAINSGRHRVITTAVQGQPLSISVDGTATTRGTVVANSTGGNTLYLFARKGPDRYCSAKLWGLKIYINNELVRDFVPGVKGGVAGLYDRQNDVWYVSRSGVPLNPGPVTEPHNTPDAYLDYVKSTGAQWVSVGITPTQTMKFDVDVDWISGNTLLGQSNYGLSPLMVNNGTIASAWWMQNGAAAADTGVALDTGRRRFVITTSNSAYVSTSVDGGTPALSGGYSNRNDVNPSDLYLFAIHYGGTVGNAGGHSTAKLYGLKIYSNGVLMRDYVPGIKDNVVGLYDRVTDRFFSSGTSTPLEAGPVVDRSKPDAFVEYVESNGSQWVDTGVDGRAGVKSEADIDWNSGAPLAVYGNNHCFLLQALGGIGGQALGSGEVKTGIAVDSGRHLIVSEVPADSKMTITVDGTTTAQSPNNVSASGNTGMTIWMFAAHSSGGAWGAGNSKFYGLKLWRTGSDGVRRIQRHFIPCVKGDRAGLYDAVSGVIFYSHSGTDLVASSTTRTLSVWRNEADDASLDNAANWCGGLPNGTDAVVCAPWLQTISTANDLTYANLTVDNGAAIDLSGHTLTLTGLTGANSGSFVSGAAVTLDLSGRTRTELRAIAKSANPYVVTWESQPDATFTLDAETRRRFKIEPDATGVKIIYIKGGVMAIVY